MNLSEFLTAARDHIARGWIRGSLSAPDGVCLIGALDRTQRGLNVGNYDLYREGLTLVREKIAEQWPRVKTWHDGLPNPSAFNDDCKRTRQDILDVFDKAIADARELEAMTPRDQYELDVLERTGNPEIAEIVGSLTQSWLERHAETLAPIMGVPAEVLMGELWEMATW